MTLIDFWWHHRVELLTLLWQHLLLVGVSTGLAIAIGVPLGIAAAHRPRVRGPLMAVASAVQTVPSLAMFGFLLPVPLLGGIGARTAILALTLYGLLPILRTTIVGITGIDRSLREAGAALGMTPRQLLWMVEVPLAIPSIVGGIRIAAVVGVGTATIAAAVGAGGLGEYIYRGLSMVDATVILAGAVPAAALALVVDGLLWCGERIVRRRRGRLDLQSRRRVIVALGGVAALAGTGVWAAVRQSRRDVIVVGSKNFAEQLALGEIVAQAIERATPLRVERRLNLGGTLICEQALRAGDIDVYVEYTGTALTAVFRKPPGASRADVTETVRAEYARTGRTLLPALGFDNTFAILVRGADARARGWRTIDDVARDAPTLRAAFGYEFLDRPDGFAGLARAYGLRFAATPSSMDLSLTYRALAAGDVDLIAGDATSGLIAALDLVQLEDTRHYFPPYDAVPVARTDTLLRHPELLRALVALAGRVTVDRMREMNRRVEALRQAPASVARDFLDGRFT